MTNQTETKATAATLVARVKVSKTGNNPCRCWVRNEALDTATQTGYTLGCGAHTRSEFAQGHDAKLKREIQLAHRARKALRVQTDAGVVETTPAEVAQLRDWERFLTEAKAKKASGPTKAELAAKVAELEAKLAK